MANVVSTLLQLLARWVDNTVGSITAQDGRNLLVSAFGYQGSGIPSANNDNVDTAGLGAFFDAGSRWEDTSTGRQYFCAAGTPGAAVWLAMMFDGQTAGGALGGAYPNPALSNTGVTSGVYGDSTHYPIFTVNPDGRLFAASQGLLPSPGAGTVTSVGLALPGQFTVTGSPVSTSGTLTGAWATQAANKVFKGPNSGSPATPTFDFLVAADIPSLDASKITTGVFSPSQIPGLPGSIITSGTIAVGFLPAGAFVFSEANGIAAAGTTQGTAYTITSINNQVTTATALSNDGAILPNYAGAIIMVWNATNPPAAVKVYPPVGAKVGTQITNAAWSVSSGVGYLFFRVSSTQWYAFLN